MQKKLLFGILILILLLLIIILASPKKVQLLRQKSKTLLTQVAFSPGPSLPTAEELQNICPPETNLTEEADKIFCYKEPIFKTERSTEINLALMKGLYYEKGKLVRVFPVLSRAPVGKWFQTPTGFYSAGVKKEKHLSSLFPVYLPNSIQYYEDFFIHAVPIYKETGEKVPPGFTGGCIRLEDNDAKFLFEQVQTGDRIIVYETFNNLNLKPEFNPPINFDKVWGRQNFNNPIRFFWSDGEKKVDYYHHAAVDLAGWRFENLDVYSIADGRVAAVQLNNEQDHGLGNTVIIEFRVKNKSPAHPPLYALYGHLDSINPEISQGREVKRGQVIGQSGNSGYGCRHYWRIGEDTCGKGGEYDTHLHFEIKTAPILDNPEGGEICYNPKRKRQGPCYGYTPDNPEKYGYVNPIEFLKDESRQ